MPDKPIRIAVTAPASPIEPAVAERVTALAARLYPERPPELVFHPQCFRRTGHFAGDDDARATAFLQAANDPGVDALWCARGGYGACRIVERVLPELTAAARAKAYLGYSDIGSLFAALYKAGLTTLAHGPMPIDITRDGGEAAVARGLSHLVERAPEALEGSVEPGGKTAAFNVATLSQIIGTPLQPDLSDHVLMLEEVSEHTYRFDRYLFHITSNPEVRRVAGIRLGRCGNIPNNDPDFGQSEAEIAAHWCRLSGIPYLGAADIGHDADNKVVPFGEQLFHKVAPAL